MQVRDRAPMPLPLNLAAPCLDFHRKNPEDHKSHGLISLVVENQMEKKMENEMETGII